MTTPITAHLRRLLLVSSVSRFDELEELARRIEREASTLAGVPQMAAHYDVLPRLRRAAGALETGAASAPASGETVLARPLPGETRQRGAGPEHRPTVPSGPPAAAFDLIELRDEALLATRSEHTSAQQVAERVAQRIGEILREEGVTALAASHTVDPKRHQVIGARETGDQALDGQIAEAVRPGYAFDGRVIRPEQVITWRAVRTPAGADG